MNPLENQTDTRAITRAAQALRDAERPLRILSLLAWPMSVRDEFLARPARNRRLPRVEYPRVETRAVRDGLARARPLIVDAGPARDWLERIAGKLELAVGMIENLGRPAFHEYSRQLYGAPDLVLPDAERTPLQLARRLRRTIDRLNHMDLGAPDDPRATADEVVSRMQAAVRLFFGDRAPAIEVEQTLSANATAGPDRIRIRSSARFTDRDVNQLIHHEAGIHVSTGLNGRAQDALPILASSHPGTTRTQEGLAVFAEFVTGSMDVDRLSRLADRVLAIDMATRGASFIEVFRYFRKRGSNEPEAFEQSRRVFRGSPLEGGAPFTKDVVYLDGLLRVHDFLRVAIAAGRADCLQLLFCGKLDLEDIPVLCALAELGMLRPPRFLPPWAADRRFLVSYLAYSGFLGRIRLGQLHTRYADFVRQAPVVRFDSSQSASAAS